MGEYSEYHIDQMFDALDDDIDDLFDRQGWYPRTQPTCKRCGKERLRWQEVETPQGEKWVLFEGKNRHVCMMSDNEFEDLSGEV